MAQLVSEHILNCNNNSTNKPPTSQSVVPNNMIPSGIQNQELNNFNLTKKPKHKSRHHHHHNNNNNLARTGSFNRISDPADTNSIKNNFLGQKSTSKDIIIDAKKFYVLAIIIILKLKKRL